MAHGRTTLGAGAKKVHVYAMIGVLKDLGWTPDVGSADLSLSGISYQANRPTHKRSRWLTDPSGYSVSASTANVRLYRSRRGLALPGRPIRIRNTEENVDYTVHLDGAMGTFIEILTTDRFHFDAEIYGYTGNRYASILHSTAPTTLLSADPV